MALAPNHWYLNYGNGSSTGYYAVTAWATGQAKSVGNLVRATAPAAGSERVFVCVVAGTTAASEPTWTTTKGGSTAESGGPTWRECTGQPAVNGDVTNTPPWATGQATALGYIIKNTAATHYFICTTSSGNTGAGEPTWDTTVGNTTNDGSNVWTCLGAVGGFSGWGAPHNRLANVFASGWAAAGDTIYVSDNHAETQASAMMLTSPGTAAAPCRVLCVDDSAEPPTALAATATITVDANAAIGASGFAYLYGITLVGGNASGTGLSGFAFFTGASGEWWLENSLLSLPGTGGGQPTINIVGYSGGVQYGGGVHLRNSNVSFGGGSGVGIVVQQSRFEWHGGALVGSGPVTLIGNGTRAAAKVSLSGVDLSVLGTGKNLVFAGNSGPASYMFNRCKIGAGVTVVATSPTAALNTRVELVNCDSADPSTAGIRYQKTTYQGSIYNETTVVRTGGAENIISESRKMVSSANSQFFSPLELGPLAIWNETTGSELTATVEIVTDNVTLTDAECWLEVEYLGTSGYPLSSFASDRAANILATPANQTTSTKTWTTTGLTTPVKQKLSVAFTPQEKGLIRCRVMLAKASTTVYVCPKIELGATPVSTRQYQGSEYICEPLLPAAEDVESGVTYGAGGTEFTGTLVGGGGGAIIMQGLGQIGLGVY